MKRTFYLLLALVMTISLFGCKRVISKEQNNANVSKEDDKLNKDILTIEDYYPFKENLVMSYEGIGNEYAEQQVFVEFIENNKMQIKIMNPGTVFVKVLEYKNGELTEVFGEGEFYHIENMLNANTNSQNIILKEPLELNNAWKDDQGNTVKITSLDKQMETPAGTYNTLEVTTDFGEGRTNKDYYAKGVGLVARIYIDGEMEVKTLLEEVNTKKQEMEILAYYPTSDDISTEYVKENIEFGTNDNIENILENIMKNPPSNKLISPISKNTNINKIHLNRDAWTLEVDFSKELIEEMNVGSSFEMEILKSVVNTLGKFYDVEKVYITVEDKPYESGHFGIKKDEAFEVETLDIKELNE
ncbi:GerMN domain-containing protein [Tissierella pigra]|uniref:GerMN domain-containing protein n=1 Tax=Tissierella pigra TaxID=2607614 RepID=A0A6N7XJ25_9FIRM|nr:GerMN domain-containing protein [Tissierella pigra]MSU01606.1 GerMN domain-containing protein [Tissierella pigra]